MDCMRFKEWLTFRESTDTTLEAEAQKHARTCLACNRLLVASKQMERTLGESLRREDVPSRLRSSVALIAEEQAKQPQRSRWPWLFIPSSALTGLALLLLVFLPFGQDLTSIEKIARLAEQNHLAGYSMEFQANVVGDISGWFRGKLPFEVSRPELADRGLKFLGGRKCSIGNEDVAYLFYSKDGKPYSLFELDADDVQVEMLEERVYRYPIGDCIVELWKEADKVFVLVV